MVFLKRKAVNHFPGLNICGWRENSELNRNLITTEASHLMYIIIYAMLPIFLHIYVSYQLKSRHFRPDLVNISTISTQWMTQLNIPIGSLNFNAAHNYYDKLIFQPTGLFTQTEYWGKIIGLKAY